MLPFFRITTLVCLSEGLRMRGHTIATVGDSVPINDVVNFADFVREFRRTYEVGSEEYLHRSLLFQESMSQIHAKNSRAGHSWTAGINPFMDWTHVERAGRLHGYVPSLARRAGQLESIAALQTGAVVTSSMQVFGQDSDSFENPTPPVRMQGSCGSCWAIASAEAVEAQIMKTNSSMFDDKGSRLSIQTLLDCVQNPKHCGGNGGCEGATAELAFDFIQENGLPLEADVPYLMEQGKCNAKPFPLNWARVTITGWRSLPSNQAQPLMQAIVESGPVVVSVAAWKGWYHYKLGIYNDCEKDSILNHGVLAKGYGAEDQVGKYWLLQNSWGNRWGEKGTIRLLRRDDEDSWCGTDTDPQQGNGCDADRGHNVTVCGSCGILYDAVVPQAGRVSFPENAIDESYQAAVVDLAANRMLATVGVSGAASEDTERASKALPRSEVTLTADSEIDAPDVLSSSQDLQSSLADSSLPRPLSQSETFASQKLWNSLGDDSMTPVPSQSETSAPQQLQSSVGDDSLTQPPSPSEMRSFGVPSDMSGTSEKLQNSLGDESLTRPPSQSAASAPQEVQSSLGDDIDAVSGASHSETSAPREIQDVLSAGLSQRERAMLDLRSRG